MGCVVSGLVGIDLCRYLVWIWETLVEPDQAFLEGEVYCYESVILPCES